MALISLRAYNKEIQKLIDNGQIEEAIAHCQYILRSFTKHIETYRLLGKAYLESQQYSEAMDIFQRVLSSVPDDFISHVGMSIIQEDKGNLNEALWHMERAFEVQPANNAIQSELKRLYGRRDGFEPPRIRLTRGALARMYVRGDLYQQATAEIRAALSEDPSRIDLELLLATVYFKSNHTTEAAETANTILNKLPFSLLANGLIYQIYTQTNRFEEAQPYRLKLESLDPYLAYTTPANPSVDQVPDNSVSIEKLTWTSPIPEATSPEATDWMPLPQAELSGKSEIRTVEEERSILPEWLRSTVEISQIPPQEEMPLWLKSAGWVTAAKTVDEATIEADKIVIPEIKISELTEEKITQDEIPDWLLEVAPITEANNTEQVITEELGTTTTPEEINMEQSEAEPTHQMEESLKENEPTLEEFNPIESRYEEPIAEQIPEDISMQWLPESELGQPDASIESDEATESFIGNAPLQETDKPVVGEFSFSSVDENLPEELIEARNDFQQGRLEDAQYKYSQLIKSQTFISTTIQDLQEIVKKYPEDAKSWQNLGDAYLRNHQIKEAMEAYSQAEKLQN